MSGDADRPAATFVVESGSPEETRRIGAALATLCRAGDLVLLAGDLGAGKTTFTQGFGRALGVTEAITSPTFTLVRRYPVPGGAVRGLVHADVYRLETLGEVADLGLDELIEDGGVALVEWGDVAAAALGDSWLSVRFEIVDDARRRLVLETSGATWHTRSAALGRALDAASSRAAADR